MRVAIPVTDTTLPTGVASVDIFNTDTLPNWATLLASGFRQLTVKLQNDKAGVLHIFTATPNNAWVPLIDITVLASNTQLAITGITNLYHIPLIGFARIRVVFTNGGVNQGAPSWKPRLEADTEYGGFVSCP